ncbi:hypothetical protein B7C42_03891 [Nocardia cerradoensis]|uniref:Uncharacterized protein n=1 Tax=Nocardia cerradoensis TaxID=85688 RepID=A0A231H674_9NOCA|nr:hypothetical protein [Nocardia cerradoensis]OXR44330.1 hypothetical protein B7C42_03891 [Nocardia cerradoensis]
MTTADDALVVIPRRTRVLHTLRVAGWLAADHFGADAPLTDATLFTQVPTPRGDMITLTPAGEHAAEVELTAVCRHLSPAGRDRIVALLDRFEQADPRIKNAVTAFQRDRGPVAARGVLELHGEVADLLTAIGDALPLWDDYPARFATVVALIESGDLDSVASPLRDSYHTVWHLLHRDLRLVADCR